MRPALVVSADLFHDTGVGIAIVAPLTTASREYPWRVRIRADGPGLRQTSWAAVEHLRSISTLRLQEYLGMAGPDVMTEVDRVLELLLLDRG